LLFHSTIWKERGLLTTKGAPIINAALITQVLEALHLPSQIGITHCKAHQTDWLLYHYHRKQLSRYRGKISSPPIYTSTNHVPPYPHFLSPH
jgi:hypothetical protein